VVVLPGPPELEERYRRFLDGRGDIVDSLLFVLRRDRRAQAGTGAWAALIISRVFYLKGNLGLSSSYLRLSSSLASRSGDRTLRLGILVNRAVILRALGRTGDAADLLRAIVHRALGSNELFVAAKAASNLALLGAQSGEADEADSYLGLAERLYSASSDTTGLIRANMARAMLEARRGMSDEALERIVGVLRRCAEVGLERETIIGRLMCAELFLDRGDLGAARSAIDQVASMHDGLSRFKRERHHYYCLEREFNEKVGRPEESRRFAEMSETLRRRLGLAPWGAGGFGPRNGRVVAAGRPEERGEPSTRVARPRVYRDELRTSPGTEPWSGRCSSRGTTARSCGAASYEVRGHEPRRLPSDAFVTGDPATVAILTDLRRASPLSLPILLLGESGTGKDLLGRLVHQWSGREGEPFVPVNVAALPIDLFESIIFGHARGAFTGAVCRRRGLAESAGGGTLFLDEIGELVPAAQAKLLRLIDRGEFIPLGEERPRRYGARIVAATNRDLEADCASGRFRADLYHRLAVLTFTIPPLRERPADIALLAEHFLRRISERHGFGKLGFGEDVLELLANHPWPGNARELESEILKAALKARGEPIRVRHLSAALVLGGAGPPRPSDGLRARIDAVAAAEIVRALSCFGGNRTKAAEALGLKRTTLLGAMKRLGIDW
jgi:DNA-binding NtrC family response regulator